MNNTLQTEIILREKIPKIYQTVLYIILIFMLTFLFTLPLNFKTFLDVNFSVKMLDDKYYITTYIKNDDLNYLLQNNIYEFDNKKYEYKILRISDEKYVDNTNCVIKLVYIDTNLDSKYLIDNFNFSAKIKKDDKRAYEYIKSYFERGNIC